jgi:hypothetical protein
LLENKFRICMNFPKPSYLGFNVFLKVNES